jgi:hypothetical protein
LFEASFFIDPELETIKLHIKVLNPGVNTFAANIDSFNCHVLKPESHSAQ